MNEMKELQIGDLVIKLPIIQGGMGVGVSLAGLASAVANQGGVGTIATAGIGMFEPDFNTNYLEANIRALKKEIQKARKLTKGILGVNIMVALSNYADLVKTSIEEEIDIIFSGAGLPFNLPEFLTKDSKTKLVPIVSSGRAAAIIAKKWSDKYNYLPDAIVVEGPKAGGHLGFKAEHLDDPRYTLENLIPEVIAAVKPYAEKYGRPIPVIAAGGIYTGQDICKFLLMGAAGVQLGTRFVTTTECDPSIKFKQAYIDSNQNDVVIIKSPVGMPGRAIRNKFIDDVSRGERKPFTCPHHCIITCDFKNTPYCIALALINAQKGLLDEGFAFAGANAYLAKEIISVKELMDALVEEYRQACQN
ncbi:MAG: nitronate monooxygenase family protein [Candidatus Edwardsbacteria bacterium]|nr:nitronate monooxygenase family protein [Candidatus Edwardsbacteria bacterium]MBU2595140.1 nitronate monooxygenase family protein [Candidatus Edwardsbacteria bacterium]